MGWLWALAILFYIVVAAIEYWHITLAIVVIGVLALAICLIIHRIKKEKKYRAEEEARKAKEKEREKAIKEAKEKRRQAEEAKRKAAEEERIRKHNEEQAGYKKQLFDLGDNLIALFEQMPALLKTAEKNLNQAEFEFSEGAFAPFWDAIEKATTTLARYHEGAQSIKINSSRYTDLITKYEGVPPQFPISQKSADKLSVATLTVERLKKIVRIAQRDFQFATIYEQRKTNQILVSGFTTLSQALDQMTWQITDSIDKLSDSLDLTMCKSMSTILSRLADMVDENNKNHSEILKIESNREIREKRVIRMLDDIQHQEEKKKAKKWLQ